MKPAIIKRSALLLALVCVLALLGAPRASAANQVADIRIKAVLQDDGSADITQTWTATTDEGTEFYLACRDNGYLSITDFTVSDERGTYEPLASWDVGADFTQKARKCGVVETGEGVELCWGISEYGTHTYTLRYTLHGLVGAYDDADGFNYRFIDEMGTFPTDVELTLTKADGTPLTDADCDIWAFGYQGQIQFVDDTIRAWTESPLEDSQNMTVMVALHKGVLHPERTEEGSFETVKEWAFGGSDYEDEPLTAKDIFYAILGVVLLCAVVAAVILIARRIHKAKLARLVKQAPYFRDAPNGGNLNVTHRLGVCSKQCEESSILGAYLLRLISDGCLEPVQQALSEKNKNASLRLVRPPRNSAGYDDALYTILEAAAGADGILQPRELALFCQHNYVPLSRFLTFSAVKLFPEFIHITLFLLIDFHNLLLRKYLAEFIIILLTNIKHLTALSKLVSQHGSNLFVSHYRSRSILFIGSRCSLSFFGSWFMVHHAALAQFFQIFLVNRCKLGGCRIIQHQGFNNLIRLHLHHLLLCGTLFLLLIISILS